MLVEKLQNLNSRQVQSQYETIFPDGIPFGTNTTGEEVKLMQRRDFQVPDRENSTVEWMYRGIKIIDIAGTDDTNKEVELEFVVDQNWRIYKDFLAWKKATYNERTGVIGDRAAVSTTIIVNALGADDSIYYTWKIKGARARIISIDPFSHEGTEYMHIRVTVIYDYIDEE